MSNEKILILGDIHLGKSTLFGKSSELNSLNSRIQDQLDVLDWAYNLCKEKDVRNIIITGDVYNDHRPHPTLINLFMKWLKQCEKDNINVHIIMGNHELIRSGAFISSALDIVNTVDLGFSTFYKDFTRLEFDNFTVILVPYRDKRMYDIKENSLSLFSEELYNVCNKDSEKIKVCIGHVAIEGSLSIGDEITDQLNELYIPTEMFDWFDYVWMGHIHHPQVIQSEFPYIAHIGSVDKTDFSKTEVNSNKIAILLDSLSEKIFTEILIPNRPLRHVKIDIPSDKESTEFVINELCVLSKTFEFKKSILKLEIQLNGSDIENVNRNKIETYLYEHLEVFHICLFSETRILASLKVDNENNFDNLMTSKEAINKWAALKFEDQEKEDFKKYAIEIYNQYEEKISK